MITAIIGLKTKTYYSKSTFPKSTNNKSPFRKNNRNLLHETEGATILKIEKIDLLLITYYFITKKAL